jgi:hypothetical protein
MTTGNMHMLFLTFLGPYSNNGCDLLLGTGTSGAHIVTHTPLAVPVVFCCAAFGGP